jgi:hypothetical protein
MNTRLPVSIVLSFAILVSFSSVCVASSTIETQLEDLNAVRVVALVDSQVETVSGADYEQLEKAATRIVSKTVKRAGLETTPDAAAVLLLRLRQDVDLEPSGIETVAFSVTLDLRQQVWISPDCKGEVTAVTWSHGVVYSSSARDFEQDFKEATKNLASIFAGKWKGANWPSP